MNDVMGIAMAIAWVVSVACSATNAVFFASYRDERRRRRIGAAVMAVVSFAILVEGLAFGAVASVPDGLLAASGSRWQMWLLARLLVCLGSVLVTLLIMRQRWLR